MSTTTKMTVHEGLSELKVLGQRIEKEIRNAKYVATNKHANTKINGVSVADFSANIKSEWDRINDLIERRNAIKRAITKSNAATSVTITKRDGSTLTMTVAELIEYKTIGIQYIEMLRNNVTAQYEHATRDIRDNNGECLEDRADKYVTNLFGNKDSVSKETIADTRKTYIDSNTLDMIDPLDCQSVIRKLNDEIDFYQTKVDAALSTSNAITTIEFTTEK